MTNLHPVFQHKPWQQLIFPFRSRLLVCTMLGVYFFIAIPPAVLAQKRVDDTSAIRENSKSGNDTLGWRQALQKGKWKGQIRYFFMRTGNEGELTDFYAHALGAGVRYESAPFHGFSVAAGGSVVQHILSSDFRVADSSTGQFSRYEAGLFDITDPYNRKSLPRAEELFLRYTFKQSFIRAGRQFINTPFVNMQDGRMRPTGTEGIWVEYNEIRHIKLSGGWLWSISPRSTTRWYRVGRSIGLYPTGVNPDGTKSGYSDHISSAGAGILQLEWTHSSLRYRISNLLTENVFNLTLLQADLRQKLPAGAYLYAGLQAIAERALANGGNDDPHKTYFQRGSRAYTFGAKSGITFKGWDVSFHFNRITSDGRFTMPREWGLEPFFTFIPREKNEGTGNTDAYLLRVGYQSRKQLSKLSLASGYYRTPDVQVVALNKYGLPAYAQINTEWKQFFSGRMKPFELQLLAVAKIRTGDDAGNKKYDINKVNMFQVNLVVNYNF